MPEVKVIKETAGPLAYRPETYFPNIPFGSLLGATPFGTTPFNLMKRFGEDFDRMFGAFVQPVAESFAPPLEVKHVAGVFTVAAELPGVAIGESRSSWKRSSLKAKRNRKGRKDRRFLPQRARLWQVLSLHSATQGRKDRPGESGIGQWDLDRYHSGS